MTEPLSDRELHVVIRACVDTMRYTGKVFDKKMLRFNDIATVARFYEKKGWPIENGIAEALCACVKGDPAYVPGRGPLTLLEELFAND